MAQFVSENTHLNTSVDICNAFAIHFSKSYSDKPFYIDAHYFDYMQNCSKVEFNIIPIDMDKIIQYMSTLHDDFSSGPDGIPPIVLKNCRSILAFPLSYIFQLSINSGIFPDIWKSAFIKPVFKKGDKIDINKITIDLFPNFPVSLNYLNRLCVNQFHFCLETLYAINNTAL